MHCAIWYHLFNLKNVKNTHGGVLLLFKLQASATGSILETRGWYIKKFSIAAAMLSNSNSFDDALHSHLYFFLSSLLHVICKFLSNTSSILGQYFHFIFAENTLGFPVFSGVIKWEHWPEIDKEHGRLELINFSDEFPCSEFWDYAFVWPLESVNFHLMSSNGFKSFRLTNKSQ